MEAKKRDSFIFYRSFADALALLPPEEYKETTQAIIEYALDGKEPCELGTFANMAFILIKPQLDANEKRAEVGKKGGAPKGNKNNAKGINQYSKVDNGQPMVNQPEDKGQPNVNDNVNVNDNDNYLYYKKRTTKKQSNFLNEEKTEMDLEELERKLTQ